MHFKFIDIGCGHTNVSVDVYGTDVKGLLVEPIQEFCNVLPNSNTVYIECAAITDYDGILEMNVDAGGYEDLQYFPISRLLDGKHRDRLIQRYKIYGMESINSCSRLGAKRTVQCMKVETLLKKYNITGVDQLKIDVEGHENVVLTQVIELMRKGTLQIHERIIFEYNSLSDKEELDKLVKIISSEFGYSSEFKRVGWNEDIILSKIKNDFTL